MTNEEGIALALEKKRKALAKKISARDAVIASFAEQNPRYAEISAEMSSCGAKLALTAISGDKAGLDALHKRLDELSEEKTALLKGVGLDTVEYECDKCLDTGYIGDRLCDCIRDMAKKLVLESLSQKAPVDKCSFESFDLSYYKDEQAKKRMTSVLKLARDYADNFGEATGENLLFMGNTGLGKTHLSLSIACEVIKKGYNVVYGSAYNLFSEMETEHFSEHTNKKYTEAVECDLLVIDDLGGEFVSPYIQSLIYNIINTRLLAEKSTVINTNLSMKEIENIYTPRVASRLIGEYKAKMFLGEDVRQIKLCDGV